MPAGWAPSRTWASPLNIATAAWARFCSSTPCRASASAGIGRVYLEVTAQNEGALRLYRRLGFVTVKTVYKAVEHVYS